MRAINSPELAEDILDVRLGGFLRNRQTVGNPFVGVTVRNKL